MDDLISRKAAIDSICRTVCDNPEICESPCDEIKVLEIIPSAQPETHDKRTETHTCDLISRQAAIAEIARWIGYIDEDMIGRIKIGLKKLPSAQPEYTNSWYINSWCIDCKEYDTEKHSCPRFNRVIKQTLDEVYAHAETEAEARFHAEIVRCKDCMYWVAHDKRCVYLNHGFAPNMWCCHGRRADG